MPAKIFLIPSSTNQREPFRTGSSKEAEKINKRELEAIPYREATFKRFIASGSPAHRNILESSGCPETVSLKRGSKVIALRTFLEGKVQEGMFGIVMGFATRDQYDSNEAVRGTFEAASLTNFSQCPESTGEDLEWPVVRFVASNHYTTLALCRPVTYRYVHNERGEQVGRAAQVR